MGAGHLPAPGGYGDQAAWVMDVFRDLDALSYDLDELRRRTEKRA